MRGPGKFASQQVSGLERPRTEWIEIPVPAVVSAEQFEQAQEQLEANKRHARRQTKEPTLLQGMLACRRCGYAYYRCATRTTKQKLYYYRCPGSDGWRWEDGVRCPSRPVRQDRLDAVVWRELVRLLEEPALIEAELERRLEAGREADPQRRRLAELRGERERLERAGARLVTAYQEELIGLDELRSRMPAMRSRKRVLEAELEAIESAAEEREHYLRIAETLESFRDRLLASAEALDVSERQKVLRSLVKEVLVGDGEITIRHSIPITGGNGSSHGKPASNSPRQDPGPQSYLLRSGSGHARVARLTAQCRTERGLGTDQRDRGHPRGVGHARGSHAPAALLRRQRLASRHRLARCQAQPAREVLLRWERRQVRPDFGQDRAGRPRADAIDARQVRPGVAEQRGPNRLFAPRPPTRAVPDPTVATGLPSGPSPRCPHPSGRNLYP